MNEHTSNNSKMTPENEMMMCASCGIKGGDNISLKKCGACGLVSYCSVKCQKAHRSKHKRVCKERVAQLRDELLFKQPESSHLGDCPICFLPLPIAVSRETQKFVVQACCCTRICFGCMHFNELREVRERQEPKCPFCRTATPTSKKQLDRLQEKRLKVDDPVALSNAAMGRGVLGDIVGAIPFFEKAAKLGDIESHHSLSCIYHMGGQVPKDDDKFKFHLEQAVIGGHPVARYHIGALEEKKGNIDRAVKHYIISASLGYEGSLRMLKSCYAKGTVGKEDFGAALRAYQAAIDATRSPQRAAADAAGFGAPATATRP